MRLSAQTSIDKKLGTIFFRGIVFCLLVTSIGFAASVIYYSRLTFTQELSSIANIAAATSRASLVFNDPKGGERVLSGFHAKPSILYAALYNDEKILVSEYGQSQVGMQSSWQDSAEVLFWNWAWVELIVPVRLEGDVIGHLSVVSSLGPLYQQLATILFIAIFITAISAIGALYFRSVLRSLVSSPIISLRDMAMNITLTKDFSARISDSRKDNDEISQLMATFNGMLEQLEERNYALVVAKNKAEDADRLKSIFLATVSHELRTPLHAILGITGEILQTPLSTQQNELLQIVNSSGTLLVSIINDILDFSKIEAGKLTLSPSATSVKECLRKVVLMFDLAARKKGIGLSVSVEDDVPEVIMIDGGRLAQVVVNLVANALKFTHSGSISVVVKKDPSHIRNGSIRLLFSVIDTGIGMEESALNSIFESFTQIRKAGEPHEGTGLGLAISSKLVMLMGGSIWVESKVGEGSRFHFTTEVPEVSELSAVPIQMPELKPIPAVASKQPTVQVNSSNNKYTVLVVEDNKINSMLAQIVLSNAGYNVQVAFNGQECLDLMVNQKIDLILMDLNMPVMDGIEATRRIRELESNTDEHVFIVALTANAIDDQSTTCLEAGMDAFFTKPLDKTRLLKSISELLANRGKTTKRSGASLINLQDLPSKSPSK